VANAQVEKLKALGLRHGEKAVVILSATVCIVLLVLAAIKPTIKLTPAEVEGHAKSAQQNLDRKQEPDNILKILEDAGIKNPEYEKLVDSQQKNALNPDSYRVDHSWVTTEPGAGLIRGQPTLIAPVELVAYPGRGGALVFDLDKLGKRILDESDKKKDDSATKLRRRRKRNRSSSSGSMASMMSSMMGRGMPGGPGGPGGNPDSPEAKKEFERKAKMLKSQLVGKVGSAKDKEKGKEGENADENAPGQGGPWKEVTKGLRWVSVTGKLDHKKMRDNYSAALKSTSIQPNYKQLDAQRSVMNDDGSWGDWEDVDWEKNHAILFNLPETEEELASQDAILDNLVDPLPFLKAGLWEKVHVASLVPKEKREIAKPAAGAGGMSGYPGMGSMGMPGMAGGGMMAGFPKGGMMPGMMGSSQGMMGMGMGGGGATDDVQDYQKSEAETVMVRSLDFTVEPDTTYRFRLRVVVFNPNFKHEDVTPGVDTKSIELKGPWSDPTEAVTMPADVTAYTMKKAPPGGNTRRTDQVSFQVTRWTPESGVTVVRNFDAGPGEVIGDPASAAIPTSEGSGAKNQLVDFTSHQLVLDTAGGPKPIAPVGAAGAALDMPALSLMVKADGTVVLRSQVNDLQDTVRKDTASNYTREVKDSTKKRESSYGSGMGMMGGMMRGKGGGRPR
jgi:hypothetical protein